MKTDWRRFSWWKFLLPLIAGATLFTAFPGIPWYVIGLALCIIGYSWSLPTLMIQLCLLFLIAYQHHFYEDHNDCMHHNHLIKLLEWPMMEDEWVKAQIVACNISGTFRAVDEKIFVRGIKPSFHDTEYHLVYGIIRNLSGNRFPGQFSYKRYGKSLGIRRSISIVQSQAINRTKVWFSSGMPRFYVGNKFIKIFSNDTLSAVSIALTTGYKRLIPKNIRENFSRAGVAHMMAVSGFHIGLIYCLLLYLTGVLKTRSAAYTASGMVIRMGSVMAYVILASMSPSALRAGILIFLYELAMILKLRTKGLNLLAFIALTMICLDHSFIESIGLSVKLSGGIRHFDIVPAIKEKNSSFQKLFTSVRA